MIIQNILKVSMGITLAAFFTACKGDKDPFSKFNPYEVDILEHNLEAYHLQSTSAITRDTTRSHSIYIDFSSGINKAFQAPEVTNAISQCFNTVLTDKFKVYKLGSGTIEQLAISNSSQLGERISNPSEYIDIYAPIQKSVEKIVQEEEEALLITDFEEWQNNQEITSTAFLKIPFVQWLKKGYSIHFFIGNYSENGVNKHIYFTVFSTSKSKGNLLSKLESKLSSLPRYDLSLPNPKIFTNYPNEKFGGIFIDTEAKTDKNKNIFDLRPSYSNEIALNFEYYPLGLDWNTTVELYQSYKSESRFTHFHEGLFIDLSNEDAYSIGSIALEVTDVETDYSFFAKCRKILSSEPKMSEDKNGKLIISKDEKNEVALQCYTEDGQLKNEYKYLKKDCPEIKELFTLNTELFENSRQKKPQQAPLSLKFHDALTNETKPTDDSFVKVAYKAVNIRPNLNNHELELFKWATLNGTENIALFESIRTTIETPELINDGVVIYTIYFKTLQ